MTFQSVAGSQPMPMWREAINMPTATESISIYTQIQFILNKVHQQIYIGP